MTQNIEYSLTEVLARIDNRLDKLDQKFDKLDQKFESKFDKLEEKINHVSIQLEKQDERTTGLGKRLENLEFIARTVGGAMIVAVLLGIAKFLFPSLSV